MRKILTAIGSIATVIGILCLIGTFTDRNIGWLSISVSMIFVGILFLAYSALLELLTEISVNTSFIRKYIESDIADKMYEEEKEETKNPAKKYSVHKSNQNGGTTK